MLSRAGVIPEIVLPMPAAAAKALPPVPVKVMAVNPGVLVLRELKLEEDR